jgi:hypothetical protein
VNDAADLSEGYEDFRGGRGGAFVPEENDFGFGFGEVSRLIRGVMRGFESVLVARCL